MSTFAQVSKQIGSKIKPETKSIAEEIYNAAKKAGHEIWYIWGIGKSAEHSTGLALDLMVRNEAAGDFIRDYVWKHRKRLRLRHVIWEQHITSTVNQPGKRRKMEDRGNPTANHFDHPHVWFFPGKYQPLPAPTPTKPATPKPPTKPALLVIDGDLGPKTISRWQETLKVSVDGKINPKGDPLTKAVQKHLNEKLGLRGGNKLVEDGKLGPKTISALQRYLKSPVDGKIDPKNSLVVERLQRRLNEGHF